MKKLVLSLALPLMLFASACTDSPDSRPRGAGEGPSASPSPVATAPSTDSAPRQLQTGEPGDIRDEHSLPWSRTEVLDERHVRLTLSANDPHCKILTRQAIDYSADAITIELFGGYSREANGCSAINTYVQITLEVDEPVAGREILPGDP